MREGDLVARRFRIEGLAGRGGMGEVYRALDEERGQRVALKLMDRTAHVDRFELEASILARLDHPGIVRYVAHGRADTDLYIAMEWLEGEDLGSRLERGRLTSDEATALVARAADALGAAHAAGVVHRDIKPANIFLVGGALEDLRLVDFGVARVSAAGARQRLTAHGAVLGTPSYMAPEQARGEPVDARADVYSLGCVLFECLASRPPFEGLHPMAVLAKIIFDEPPRVSEIAEGVPEALDRLVTCLLSKDREQRPADGSALLARLVGLATPASARFALAPPSLRALGRIEQRLICVVLLAHLLDVEHRADPIAATLSDQDGDDESASGLETVRAIAGRSGARVERLLDGSVVVVHAQDGAAVDLAAEAARSALALRRAFPRAPIALATGRAISGPSRTVGDALDRASALVEAAGAGGLVSIDEISAGLLATRFEVHGETGGLALGTERSTARADRTLLGKATPFVGRDAELAQLLSLVRDGIARGAPRAALVTAPSGVGKSRLRYELLRSAMAEHRDAQIWVAWGDAAGAGSPLGLVAPMLRRIAGIASDEPSEIRIRKMRACVARSVPDAEVQRVSEFLGELAGVPFGDGSSVPLRAARAEPTLLADQVRRAWEDFVAAELAVQPIVLLVEDLHWGDRRSVDLIDSALARAQSDGLPLIVLAFGRPEVTANFPSIWAERGALHLPLGELHADAGAILVRAVLGTAPPSTVAALLDRSGGNAFYLEELIRAVAEGRDAELPETALAVAHARLASLDGEARRVLRAASIFGRRFRSEALVALVDLDVVEVRRQLAELAAAEVVTPVLDGGRAFYAEDAWDFCHALFRDAAYAMLTEGDRALGHGLAGAWLEGCDEHDATVIATHFERASEPARAAPWYRRAAEQARDGNDLDALLDRIERAFRCGATGAMAGELRALHAEGLRWRSDHPAAAEAALEALKLLAPGSPSWFSASSEAVMALGRLGRVDEVVGISREMLAVANGAGASVSVIAALARAHEQLVFSGRYELATEVAGAMAVLAGLHTAGDPVVGTWLLFARADAALVVDDRGLYVELMQSLVAAFDAIGDVRSALLQRSNLADAYLSVGHAAEAVALCRETLAAGPRWVSPHAATAAKLNLARALARLGDPDAAVGAAAEATEEARKLQAQRLFLISSFSLAEILLQRGDAAQAEETVAAALEQENIPRPLHALLCTRLAEAKLARGDALAARALAIESMATLIELGVIEEGEFYIRRVHAEALAACGEEEAARQAIAKARDRLLAAADRVHVRWLEGYLGGVPDHARTLALAAALRV